MFPCIYMHLHVCMSKPAWVCHNKIPWTAWLNQEKKISPVLVARSVSSGCQRSWILVRSPFLTCRQLPSHCIYHRQGRRGVHAHVFSFFKKNFFGQAAQYVGSQFPDQGSNLQPLLWKHRVLTTGLPGKSSHVSSYKDINPIESGPY